MLATITEESAVALSAADDDLLARIGRAVTHSLFYPISSLSGDPVLPICGDGRSICTSAKVLATTIPRVEEIANLSQIADVGLKLLEPKDIFEGVTQVREHVPQFQILFFDALRTLVHSDPTAEAALWDILQNNEWREQFLNHMPFAVIDVLADTIAYLVSIHDRWRAFGPHMFALGALAATNDADRRQALFALTILLSLAAGTTSAIRRILQTKKRSAFRDDVTYWRDRISLAMPMASSWAQGRLRALLSELHFA